MSLHRTLKLPRFAQWWKSFLKEREADLAAALSTDLSETGEPAPDLEARQSRLMSAANRAEALGLAYVLTGDERFGVRGRELLAEVVADDTPTWMTPAHKRMYPEVSADLHVAILSKTLAHAYDWLCPLLDCKLTEVLWETMRTKGAGVIYRDSLESAPVAPRETVNPESQIRNRKSRKAWWSDAYNSNWCSVVNSGLGIPALAFRELDRRTTGRWLSLAKQRLLTMLDLVAEEGAGLEGTSYWFTCFGPILEFSDCLANVTGEDLFRHPFWRVAHECLLYQTMPDFSGFANFGDAHYPGVSGSWVLYGIASRANNGRAQWLANRISERSGMSHHDLLFHAPEIEGIPPEGLPTGRFFFSIHLATFRSGWDQDAVFFALKGGSNSWSHCHLDLNSFVLHAYGEPLAIDPGTPGYGPHYFNSVEPPVSTAWHNTIAVDGANQRQPPRYRMSYDLREGGDAYCALTDHLACEGLEMIRGDATTAYADMLKRFHREVVYLKPNCFILYDDIITNDARTQRHFEWLLHSVAPMVDLGGRIEIRGAKATLVVDPLLPQPAHYKFPEGRFTGSRSNPVRVHCLSLRQDWQHLWNVTPGDSPYPQWDARRLEPLFGPRYRYLVVLTALKAGDSSTPCAELVPVEEGVGVRLTSGERVDTVIFNPNRKTVRLVGTETDGEKVVVREQRGEVTSWCAVRGRILCHRDRTLLNSKRPTSRAEDCQE